MFDPFSLFLLSITFPMECVLWNLRKTSEAKDFLWKRGRWGTWGGDQAIPGKGSQEGSAQFQAGSSFISFITSFLINQCFSEFCERFYQFIELKKRVLGTLTCSQLVLSTGDSLGLATGIWSGGSIWDWVLNLGDLILFIGCCSVTKLCLTLWDPINWSTPGFPILHYLLGFAQAHIHWVSETIQPSLLSPTSPPSFNLSQHQGLFQWISSSHQVAKVLELQHQSFQWIFRVDFL